MGIDPKEFIDKLKGQFNKKSHTPAKDLKAALTRDITYDELVEAVSLAEACRIHRKLDVVGKAHLKPPTR